MTAQGQTMPWDADDAISHRAADYYERRRFGDWSTAEEAELDAWLTESTLHRVAWLRLEGIVAHAQRLAAQRPGDAVAPAGRFPARRLMLPLLAAASIALAAALGIPFAESLMQSPDRTYSTDVGGLALLKFADGTQIELDTDTVLRFRMTGEERKVWLERGEAWFRVAHNAANPFTVFVGRHRVTDLGTEFLVRTEANGHSDGMEVALLSGRATLSAEGAPITVLAPGDEAIATPVSLSVTRRTPQQLADALAWRRGVLVFRRTRLADVVRELNRYNETKLVVADPSIADIKITAELKTNDFEGFLQLAQAVLNLRVDHAGNDILISRAPKNSGRHGSP